jgi:uncharacterized protein (DUF58 family)
MNKKSTLHLLLILSLIMGALIFRKGELLSLAIPFLVYLIIGLIQAPSDLDLAAKRTIDRTSVPAGGTVETSIVIKNQGAGLANLYLEDTLFPSMSILEGEAQGRVALARGETVEFNYTFTAERGVYPWKMVRACASDPFGLFDLETEIPAFGNILVRPAPMKIRPVAVKPLHTLHAPGPIPSRLAGSGTDFWGVREYLPGDPLRQINWRLKARHPRRLFTNEFEREEIADFGLILDTRRFATADALEESLFEHTASAATAFSESLLKVGNRVSLLVYGKSITTVFPGSGKSHGNRLLRSLARARLGEYIPFTYLDYFPTRLFPARSVIVIFSSVHPHDLDVYARLRSYHYEVLLISPDPVGYASRKLPQTEINSLALRLARLERIVLLKQLVKLGVKVVDWQVNEPLDKVLNYSLNQLARRRDIRGTQ